MANRVSERFGIPVRTELLDGQPAMALSAYAQETDVELIMMTAHGRSGLSRAWLGSVADGVIRRSGVPVLLLRPTHDEVDFDESITPRHILIPLDGSELSRGVIDPATWLGSLSGARFTLLRVVLPLPLLRPPFPSAVPGFDEAVLEEQRVHARAEMDSIAEHLRERGIDVEVAIVSHSVPAGAIIEFAESNAIDMIALATHGRGGWTRIALGSVADKVVRGSQIPVMVYRPKAGRNGGNVIERAAVGAHA
jgi:nucleotide-binding universal stress UspA family protein